MQDACVIGVTINGEVVPRAYVVLQGGEKGSVAVEREIRAWVEKRASKHKWLTGGVGFVDLIPKNPVCLTSTSIFVQREN